MTDFDKGYADGRDSYDREWWPVTGSVEYLRGFAAGRKAGPSGTVTWEGVSTPRSMEPA